MMRDQRRSTTGRDAMKTLTTALLGMLGATIAVLRITRIDPLRALGGQR